MPTLCHLKKIQYAHTAHLYLNNMNSEYRTLRSFQIKVVAFFSLARGKVSAKQKKSIDQRTPQIGYEGIKSLRSLAMKNYLVTGGLIFG